jgi:hypothetical protein
LIAIKSQTNHTRRQKKINLQQVNNSHFNTVIVRNEKHIVTKEYKKQLKIMLFNDSPSVLKFVRSSKYSWMRSFERIQDTPDCIFFKNIRLMLISFGKHLKVELAKINISLIVHLIEIMNPEQVIEKDLEELFKKEIGIFKDRFDDGVMPNCFDIMKIKERN